MSRITKSVTFDNVTDADLLAWIHRQMLADARPGERPDFSRFVRGVLYRAFQKIPDTGTGAIPDTLLADIRAVVEAAVSHALLAGGMTTTSLPPDDRDDTDFSGLLLD